MMMFRYLGRLFRILGLSGKDGDKIGEIGGNNSGYSDYPEKMENYKFICN